MSTQKKVYEMNKNEFNVAESRNGFPIIEAIIENQLILLHSKYDPIKEAERLIGSFKDKIERADHVLFYGAGIGYVVRSFFERYPNKLASVYEPIDEVANLCIQHQGKSKFPLEYLENYVVENEQKTLEENLEVFGGVMQHKFEIIVLPSYERWQRENLKKFVQAFKKWVDNKQANVGASTRFSRRWTINSLMNLSKTFEHPNLLLEKKKYFEGKPVLLVSAGPSLSEEIENIKKIKEDGLAYIFAVGSANKVLVQEGILPDAVCTYDPQKHNYAVFKELYELGIDTVPMIYGSTVGYETLEFYRGPKLYIPTSQDKLIANFRSDKQIFVDDATSIAIVTIQILTELEVGKIILVGQNFAFKKDQFYAKGINRYDKEKREMTDNSVQKKDLIRTFEVEDVHGDKVLTNISFNRMKENMENYLKQITIPVINTTNGGAAIEGTTFLPLQHFIAEELIEKVVVDNWWKSNLPERSSILNQAFLKKYSKEFDLFIQQDKGLEKFLKDFQNSMENLKVNQILRKLEKFDDLFQKYHQNAFYLTTILPIAQLAFEKLKAETQLIRTMNTSAQKAKKVIQVYYTYLANCRAIYRDIAPIVTDHIFSKLGEKTETKGYVSTSGVFQYIGDWKLKYHSLKENVESAPNIYNIGVETIENDACIVFRFSGTTLSLFGTIHTQKALKLHVQIDDEVNKITIRNRFEEDKYGSFKHQKIFEVFGLEEKMHEVKVTVISAGPSFVFEGIEIDENSRAYHVDEVMSVEELKIGKRIRCSYKAIYNQVGDFSGLGNEINKHLPVNSSANPNGDFYFIMVDEIDSKLILLADRIIQNHIAVKKLLNLQKTQLNIKTTLRLLNDNEEPKHPNSEWNKYVVNSTYKDIWNVGSTSTWTATSNTKCENRYVSRGGGLVGNHICNEFNVEHTAIEQRGFRPVLEIKI